ncbi:MAG: hypothetical protein EPN39_05260 [Chitinophagaceae bacterium]|nr:MAG: hypothetical protein EPN39_05260 [Chitinophagaceae bacterium]
MQTKPSYAQELPYPPLKEKWDADSLGNHRAVIEVTGKGNIAKVKIEWRRRDEHPENKEIILVDAATGKRVMNLYAAKVNRAYCIIYFQPVPEHKTYFVYYMPYRLKGSANYPNAVYPAPVQTASDAWLAVAKRTNHSAAAHLVKLEPVDLFNSFYPMEMIATQEETNKLIREHPHADYLVFPEDRLHPIKMEHDLPYRWIQEGVKNTFSGKVDKGAYYAFQLGIYPVKEDLQNVKIHFSSFINEEGNKIPDSLISCINTNGVSYSGQPETFQVNIPEKNIQAMWCYIKVPENIKAGFYAGTATVTADGVPDTKINLHLEVSNQVAVDHGVNEPWKMTRLPWLNSTLFQNNTVIPPYTPLRVNDNTISLLGRKMTLAKTGLPEQIQTYFPIEMTSIRNKANDLLAEAIHFHFFNTANKNIELKNDGISFTKETPGTVEWTAKSISDSLEMDVKGHIEFDGFVSYRVQVIALQNITLDNTELHIPLEPDMAKYFMGLGYKGEYRPEKIDWKWNVATKNQDGGWIGTVNAGLHFELRDQHYSRPLNTNFYLLKPLVLPSSWGNDNKGGIQIWQKGKSVLVNAYSGDRTMQKGDTLYYDFNLLITPFHQLFTDQHFSRKYYHDYNPVDTAKEWGANIINIHQGNYINPYINYPFIATNQMKNYIDSAHRLGMYVKIYNTIRELADRAYELYPLFSLNHEIFPAGKGGGYPWLQEHLNGSYIPGWYTPRTNDAAIVDGGASRWHNYYIEGINWLVKNVGIDGLYLDDVAFDRITMKRVKRALLEYAHPGIIDLHSANQHDKNDGWNNSANLYMTLFPYINRLWFGEYFDYENNGPDYFMTEISGIPYGLMGEMLWKGGNPWRGMLYGMTSRAPWSGDPRPIWKVWNEFGIVGSQMIGYWVPDNPVKTDNPDVLATIYKKPGAVLVSIASWAKRDTTIHLMIDWKGLGINPSQVKIIAPYIRNFQPAATFKINEEIPVAQRKGWLLIIK